MVAPASAVFTDISDSRVSQTAAVLDALGIMQGVGGGSFAPGKALTRAQFCKLAVTAMGVTDVSPYASYTIFRMLSIRTGQRRISTRQYAIRS